MIVIISALAIALVVEAQSMSVNFLVLVSHTRRMRIIYVLDNNLQLRKLCRHVLRLQQPGTHLTCCMFIPTDRYVHVRDLFYDDAADVLLMLLTHHFNHSFFLNNQITSFPPTLFSSLTRLTSMLEYSIFCADS